MPRPPLDDPARFLPDFEPSQSQLDAAGRLFARVDARLAREAAAAAALVESGAPTSSRARKVGRRTLPSKPNT